MDKRVLRVPNVSDGRLEFSSISLGLCSTIAFAQLLLRTVNHHTPGKLTFDDFASCSSTTYLPIQAKSISS